MKRVHKPAMIRSAARRFGSTLAATIENEQLMFDEHGLGNDGTEASGQCKAHDSNDQVNEKDDEITPPGMVSNLKKPVIFGPIQ